MLILVAAMFYGLITVAGKYFSDQGFSLYEISMLIVFVPLPLIPLLILRPEYRVAKERLGFYAIFGIIGAGLQVTQFGGIVLGVPVAIVALLLYTQPVWTTVLGRVMLRERITPRKTVAAALAVAGMVVLVDPFGSELTFDPLGFGSAIMAGLFLSLWVVWGRKSGLKSEHFITTTFGYSFFTAICLLLFLPILRLFLDAPEFLRLDFTFYLPLWPFVAGFALFAGILPACLAFAGMCRVDASTAGVLLLLEPVSAAVLAYLFFGQALTNNIYAGGACILLANYVLLRR